MRSLPESVYIVLSAAAMREGKKLEELGVGEVLDIVERVYGKHVAELVENIIRMQTGVKKL